LSRIEWALSVPLPRTGERDYEVEFTVEVPQNLFSTHNPWDHKQTFTRLTSPVEEGALQVERSDMDELRRDTLGVAHRLKTLRRTIDTVAANGATLPDKAEQIATLVAQAADLVAEMRRCLDRPPSETSLPRIVPEMQAEWRLADEFLSHGLLEFLGGVTRVADGLSKPDAPDKMETEELRCLLSEALAEELVHRRARGYLNPAAESQDELGRFVERGSQLKKHFHGVLFLDVESWMTDHKLRNWTGVLAASLAAAFWLGFTLLPIGPGARAGIGLGTFAVMFAVSYALKDRIKELTRSWITGRLTALYGQRMVKLRLPRRIDTSRPTLVDVRETFSCLPTDAPDVLNRHVGNPRKVVCVTFRMKVELHPAPILAKKGIHSVKHVFRYDMTPIFCRLDDAVKPVPVLDPASRRVRFVEAPKQYRMPTRVVVREGGGETARVDGEMVVSKRGIERFARDPPIVPIRVHAKA
jgi:hypothetical protein